MVVIAKEYAKNYLIKCMMLVAFAASILLLSSCSHDAVPRPRGYYRIDLPTHSYSKWTREGYPYSFNLPHSAKVDPHIEEGERYWIDINYPSLNATIHCSYKRIDDNLPALTTDALEFVYKHVQQASAIPESEYENDDERVYGVVFELQGNTASPYQFFLTDSVNHFFRAALYCNCTPNADSLVPVYDFIKEDMLELIESFRWQ